MKYLVILFLSLSLSSFAQSEKTIFLQTSPEERYVITCTYGNYTFLFDYNTFLDGVSINKKEREAIQALIDPKIQAQGSVDLNAPGQRYYIDGEATALKELTNKKYMARLINKGDLIILNASGKMNVGTLVRAKKSINNSENHFTYTNPDTGEVIFEYNNYLGRGGCPSF